MKGRFVVMVSNIYNTMLKSIKQVIKKKKNVISIWARLLFEGTVWVFTNFSHNGSNLQMTSSDNMKFDAHEFGGLN